MNLTKNDIENIQMGLVLLITKEKMASQEDRVKIQKLKNLIYNFENLKK